MTSKELVMYKLFINGFIAKKVKMKGFFSFHGSLSAIKSFMRDEILALIAPSLASFNR